MKKATFFLFTTMLAANFLLVSCSKDDDQDEPLSNEFSYNGSNYDLTHGGLNYYGSEGEASYLYSMLLFSSHITYNPAEFNFGSGDGEIISFTLYSSSDNELADGVYDITQSEESNTAGLGSFLINYDYVNETSDDEGIMISGTIEVEKTGTSYNIIFDCKSTNGKTIRGNYEGTLAYTDWGIF